jgi:pyrroline-5-carboxylate reductase
VFRECDLVLICVLPHQLGAVAADYRACTAASHAVVAVLSSSIPARKLQSMFGNDTVVHLVGMLAASCGDDV